MSLFSDQTSLAPRNGQILIVGIVARISGCQNQKELSLEDQADHCKEFVEMLYDGPVEYHVIATKGKGEQLNRPEIAQVEQLLRRRKLDLLVVEELSRLIRGGEATRLCGLAVDNNTRVLAPNDSIDTNDPNWEASAMKAATHGVEHNILTSLRIKHKMMNRFVKQGGNPAVAIFGYTMPPVGKTYGEMQKLESAVPIYKDWFRLLHNTRNCSAVADWLNQTGVDPGPYMRSGKWTGAAVRRCTGNPILIGLPWRGRKESKKHYESGKRVSRKNPKGPKFYPAPHLAFVTPAEFNALNSLLDKTNAKHRRRFVNGVDPLLNTPRKRTRFPAQHARCWYCGRQFVRGGNGIPDDLMCKGSRDWRCWNSIAFDGTVAAKRLVEVITTELYRLDGFDAQFFELVSSAVEIQTRGSADRWKTLERDEARLTRQRENVKAAIVEFGANSLTKEMLDELTQTEQRIAHERWQLETASARQLVVPATPAELRGLIEEQFTRLAIDSPEFGDLMRLLVPDFHVYLVRLCDGGHLRPRARVKLDLAGSVADAEFVPGLNNLLSRTMTVDLFDPPQREQIRADAVRLAAAETQPTLKQIAAQLPANPTKPSGTAVGHALALDRKMKSMALTTPYVLVSEPPEDFTKLRRHKNAKYRFEPLENYQRPPF